jgi:hypothetical protein
VVVQKEADQRLDQIHLVRIIQDFDLMGDFPIDQVPVRVVHGRRPCQQKARRKAGLSVSTYCLSVSGTTLEFIKECLNLFFRQRGAVSAQSHNHADALFPTFSRRHFMSARPSDELFQIWCSVSHCACPFVPFRPSELSSELTACASIGCRTSPDSSHKTA